MPLSFNWPLHKSEKETYIVGMYVVIASDMCPDVEMYCGGRDDNDLMGCARLPPGDYTVSIFTKLSENGNKMAILDGGNEVVIVTVTVGSLRLEPVEKVIIMEQLSSAPDPPICVVKRTDIYKFTVGKDVDYTSFDLELQSAVRSTRRSGPMDIQKIYGHKKVLTIRFNNLQWFMPEPH